MALNTSEQVIRNLQQERGIIFSREQVVFLAQAQPRQLHKIINMLAADRRVYTNKTNLQHEIGIYDVLKSNNITVAEFLVMIWFINEALNKGTLNYGIIEFWLLAQGISRPKSETDAKLVDASSVTSIPAWT